MIAFASAMASCGIRVLTPELPDIKDYHVGANSIATIGDSAAWLSQQSNGRPAGVMGLSFSGGLALLATADPIWQQHIKFVVAIGSQDEMSRVAAFYRTGTDLLPDGSEETLTPHEYGALVLEYEDLEDFAPQRDLAPIRAVLRAHLYEDRAAEDAALARLNPAQRAQAAQLMDTTSPLTRQRLAAAEARHIHDMASVSPHGHLDHLTTPVYLLHGAADNIIPSAETQWMEAELPSETLKAALISPVLSHLDMDGANPTFLDQPPPRPLLRARPPRRRIPRDPRLTNQPQRILCVDIPLRRSSSATSARTPRSSALQLFCCSCLSTYPLSLVPYPSYAPTPPHRRHAPPPHAAPRSKTTQQQIRL